MKKTIILNNAMQGMILDTNSFHRRLEDRRDELYEERAMSKDSRKPVELDQTAVGRLSRMDALQVQAMALETERRRDQELSRIESALQRIKDGDFGYCVECGEEISVKRLENDPTAPLCIRCASRHEGH